jgi:cyclopropane-fatty-acyl-phospholipid synthase
MNSRIYRGKVMHKRHIPVQQEWIYPFYFYAIDIDELNELDRSVKGFAHNHWRPVSLRDSDYLKAHGALRTQLSEFIEIVPSDRIMLITVARFLTRIFKPVSFYYVQQQDGTPKGFIAEVNNTFGQRHVYIMEGGDSFPVKCSHVKEFHVSPFNNMEGHYEFTFSAPDQEMHIAISLIRDNKVILDAAMWGAGNELNTRNLWSVLLRQPFTAALTMPRILHQAARLYFRKKMRVFSKPAPSSPMTIKV